MAIHWQKHWAVFSVIFLFISASIISGCGNKNDAKSEESTSASQVKEGGAEADIAGAEADVPQHPDIIPDEGEEKELSEEPASPHPIHMGVWGNCGGTGFLFDMNGTKGSYIPYDIAEAKEYGARRDLELVSYTPKDGKCVINAYLQGKYIGQFKGIFMEEEVNVGENTSNLIQSYDGIFTSVNGAKLDFHFHYD